MSDRPLVLLVEDYEPLRFSLGRLLRQHGVDVAEAANGAEGLERLLELGERVRLVITDHQMPRVPGDTFATMVREIRPALPIIRMSGGLADGAAYTDGMPKHDNVVYLAKPFDLDLFMALVDRFLGERDRTPGLQLA